MNWSGHEERELTTSYTSRILKYTYTNRWPGSKCYTWRSHPVGVREASRLRLFHATTFQRIPHSMYLLHE